MILFLTHQASLTGAPILLRDFLIYFKENTTIPFEIGVLQDGNLITDYQHIAPTNCWDLTEHPPMTLKQNVVYGIKKMFGIYETQAERFVKYVRSKNIRLIYSNTLVNGDFLEKICSKLPDIQVIVHAHELEIVMQIFDKMGKVQGSLKHATQFVACSEMVKNNLVLRHDIPSEKIEVVHEFCRDYQIKNTENLRQNLHIPQNATVVMGCGTFDWRKGVDLFLQIAKKLGSENLHFIWVGGDAIQQEFFRTEIADKQQFIHFIPHTNFARNYYEIADIFTLLSREEAFGIVGLEAGLMEIPVIYFENVGFGEIMTEKTGFAVPIGDIDAVIENIKFFHKNPKKRKEMGENLRNCILTQFSWEISSQKIIKVIQSIYQPM